MALARAQHHRREAVGVGHAEPARRRVEQVDRLVAERHGACSPHALPHLPSLDIRDGAVDFLLELYISILPSLGDYLTRSGGNLNLSQVDVLLARVGEIEDVVSHPLADRAALEALHTAAARAQRA